MAEDKNTKKKLTLKVEDPMSFDGFIDTYYTDSISLSERIHEFMDSFFADYFGTKIQIDAQTRSPLCILAFKENQAESNLFRGIERAVSKAGDMNDRINMINSMQGNGFGNRRKMYRLTQDAKELLEDIVPNMAKDNKGNVNWDKITGEDTFGNNINNYGQNYLFYRVNVDLNRLVRAMFGAKNKEGENYQYMVNVGNPLVPTADTKGRIIANNWQLFIMRLNSDAVNRIARNYGYGTMNNQGFV